MQATTTTVYSFPRVCTQTSAEDNMNFTAVLSCVMLVCFIQIFNSAFLYFHHLLRELSCGIGLPCSTLVARFHRKWLSGKWRKKLKK